jgi:uncharacterized membrane protein HdeD (DUF308 family)
MNLTSLIRNWWMIAIRGVLAIVFGLAVLLWPRVTLPTVTVLFGVYAILDGVWTLAAARRASERLLEAWPVVLEGAVSIGLGLLALFFPFVSRQFIYALATWGVITGVLELIAAICLPREGAGHWLLGTAGVSSLFLALMILLLGHSDTNFVVRVIATYAQVFGTVLLLAALLFGRGDAAARRYGTGS